MPKPLASAFELSIKASALVALACGSLLSPAQAQVGLPDMVSRTALRVCEDPSDMPYSDRKGEGFENKIAEIVAKELKLPLRYFWAPSGPGFVRNTLQSDLCDVIMGYAAGAEIVLHTNPYYRSTYVIVTPKGSPLGEVKTLDDSRLKGHHIGVVAATPPVDVMLAKGLMIESKVYPLLVDHRFSSPLTDLIDDLKAGKIDAAVVWGPLVGLDVKKSNGSLVMTPLLKAPGQPDFSYRITMGVRHNEVDWKHKLEAVIRTRQGDINKVLEDYGVPLLDNSGALIAAEAAEKGKGATP